MADLIEKPTEGFQTPYQLLLDLVGERILSKANNELTEGLSLFDRWSGIAESETDIEVPSRMEDAKGEKYWMTYVSCSAREIGRIPVRFYTYELTDFLKSVLTDGSFKPYTLGRQTKEEGFYYSEGSGEIILVVKTTTSFCKGIRFSGLEFKPSMYLITEGGQSLYVDCPFVNGEMQIMYIN